MMQITYQKKDGSIIHRTRSTTLPYKIGDITSMGWKVLNIEYEYNNKFYSMNEYYELLNKNKQKVIKARKTKELLTKEIRTLIHYCIVIWLLTLLNI